jgi:hypothetical protein
MITAAISTRTENRITYRDGETIVGEVLTATSHSGRQVFVAFAHDWDGDSESYDPLVAVITDDPEQAKAEIVKRYRGYLNYLAANGVTVTATADVAAESATFDPQATYDALNRKQRIVMRNVLAVERNYRNGAVPAANADVWLPVTTMDTLNKRGLLKRPLSGLSLKGSAFEYGYQLTPEGRAVAELCEEKYVKLAHPADDGDPFAGMGADTEED